MSKETIAIKKNKGNPILNRENKKFLKIIKRRYGKLYAHWVSSQFTDIEID